MGSFQFLCCRVEFHVKDIFIFPLPSLFFDNFVQFVVKYGLAIIPRICPNHSILYFVAILYDYYFSCRNSYGFLCTRKLSAIRVQYNFVHKFGILLPKMNKVKWAPSCNF